MWMLLVLDIVGKDPKVTFYDNFDTQQKCEIVEKKLKAEFKAGENTQCYYVEYLMPKKQNIAQSK